MLKFFFYFLAFLLYSSATQATILRALIIDGRNNHEWQITTDALRAALESTGRFNVSVSTAPELKIPSNPRAPKEPSPAFDTCAAAYSKLTKSTKDAFGTEWNAWTPNFAAHDVVILNYNGPNWPEATKTAFTDFLNNGGGVLLVHAANNGFRDWQEFNDIIGMGWRPKLFGRALKINPNTGEHFGTRKRKAPVTVQSTLFKSLSASRITR